MMLRSVITLRDTPHSIALGTAVGTFIGLTPTVGIQMILVLTVAAILRPLVRFNRIAALIAVYISNPITTLPIYWFNYKLGTWFVAGQVTYQEFTQIFHYEGFSEWLRLLADLTYKLGWPLVIGSGIVALVFGVVAYFVIKPLVIAYQRASNKVITKKDLRTDAIDDRETVSLMKQEAHGHTPLVASDGKSRDVRSHSSSPAA